MKKSGRRGNNSGFKIGHETEKLAPIDLEKSKLGSKTEPVSISLKYYRHQTECFSAWNSGELKKFSGTVEKLRGIDADTLKGHKPLCVPHRRAPAEQRFTRPNELSEDLSFFEIKVDPSNAARIHGVFVGSVFFLVWLDRLHAVYPER